MKAASKLIENYLNLPARQKDAAIWRLKKQLKRIGFYLLDWMRREEIFKEAKAKVKKQNNK